MTCLHPVRLPTGFVPCGKCVECLKRRQREWFIRLEQECLVASSAFFVTLTYGDEFLFFDSGIAVVSRRDCQLFFKRLRKTLAPDKIRYFLCSEYGPTTLRPHYHIILFNFPVEKFDVYETILSSWRKGFVKVDPISSARLNYVAKYVVCGYVLPEFLDTKSRRPFSLQSRHPGIGASYLSDRNVERHRRLLSPIIPVQGHPEWLPRYYRDRIFNEDQKSSLRERSSAKSRDRLLKFVEDNFNDNPLDLEQYSRIERELEYRTKLRIKSGRKL